MKYLDIFEKEEGVRAFFTTKDGAVEGTPGGTIFDNEPLFAEMGLAGTFKVWPRQVHGTNIEVIKASDLQRLKEADPEGIVLPDTDGIMTDAKGVLLTSVHADCLPVYLYDAKNGVIGLVHAGWRGTVAGIVPQAIRRMVAVLGAGRDHLKVYIGPGISKCCFEVGPEVASQFLLEWGSSFSEPVTSEFGEEKYMLDLKDAVRQQVIDCGIPEENIETSPHCTCCEPELFCSYRREGGTYMRMGAGIVML